MPDQWEGIFAQIVGFALFLFGGNVLKSKPAETQRFTEMVMEVGGVLNDQNFEVLWSKIQFPNNVMIWVRWQNQRDVLGCFMSSAERSCH